MKRRGIVGHEAIRGSADAEDSANAGNVLLTVAGGHAVVAVPLLAHLTDAEGIEGAQLDVVDLRLHVLILRVVHGDAGEAAHAIGVVVGQIDVQQVMAVVQLVPVQAELVAVEGHGPAVHPVEQAVKIGDLGRFVTEPCPCGRTAPRFELLGRFGDIFKFATNYVNYKTIKAIFGEQLGYTGWLQVVLTYDAISRMTILVEEDLAVTPEEALKTLREAYPEIEECLRDKTGDVVVEKHPKEDFLLSSGGGKVRSVVDKRI